MKDETLDTQEEMIELLQDELGLQVTNTSFKEYIRGDPTNEDAPVTGAEITLTAYIKFEEEGTSDDNPYRYK